MWVCGGFFLCVHHIYNNSKNTFISFLNDNIYMHVSYHISISNFVHNGSLFNRSTSINNRSICIILLAFCDID